MRLFEGLPAREHVPPHAEDLGGIGGPMDGGYAQVSNAAIPAGYTYFAQFVMHDLTFEPSAPLELRSLYGLGPIVDRRFYDHDQFGALLGGKPLVRGTLRDLPRDSSGLALIPDVRNDRTIMLGQVHAAMLQLHNSTLEGLRGPDPTRAFAHARALVIGHYRRLIGHDLLPRIVAPSALTPGRVSRMASGRSSAIPDEFLFAVGQVGHSMVKPRYRINDDIESVLFGHGNGEEQYQDLRGQPLDERGAIDWAHFFPIGNPSVVQHASIFNTRLCRPLFEVPTSRATSRSISLPYLALAGAERIGLPSGEAVTKQLGFAPLPTEVVWQGLPYRGTEAPLWYYVLREAAAQQAGRRLGDTGSAIFARVILDALGTRAAQVAQVAERCDAPMPPIDVGETLAAVANGARSSDSSSRASVDGLQPNLEVVRHG